MEANERIKELRLDAGLTQEELGQKLGVQKSAIAKWENGRVKNLKSKHVLAMAKVFGVKPSYVMAMEESEPAEDDMVKVSENLYELSHEEEAILSQYNTLDEDRKELVKKYLELLATK